MLKRAGVGLTYNDEQCIKNLTQEILPKCIDFNKLEMMLSELGIQDEIPKSNKHLDYSSIKAPAIRIFNKIAKTMAERNIDSIADFLGPENFNSVDVVIGGNNEKLDIIDSQKLQILFHEKGIVDHGQDMDDEFIYFV